MTSRSGGRDPRLSRSHASEWIRHEVTLATTVGQAEISEDVRALLSQGALNFEEGALILLPVRLSPDGTGQYRDTHLTIPKELRHFGVPADFLQFPEERTGLSEFSTELVLAFAFGVAQNMTWDAAKTTVQYIYARAGQLARNGIVPQVSVSVARVSRADGTVLRDVKIQGPADDDTAAEIIRALTGDSGGAAPR